MRTFHPGTLFANKNGGGGHSGDLSFEGQMTSYLCSLCV